MQDAGSTHPAVLRRHPSLLRKEGELQGGH